MRVRAYIDGFNLYHAIDKLNDNRLKWVDLRKMVANFIDPHLHTLDEVFYFSAYATWKPDAYARHMQYVRALQMHGVTPVMGKFKVKDRSCNKCGATWKGHEEKETDVNIALSLLDHAYQDLYDEAIVVSQDSDLFPAIKLTRQRSRPRRSRSSRRRTCRTARKWPRSSTRRSWARSRRSTSSGRCCRRRSGTRHRSASTRSAAARRRRACRSISPLPISHWSIWSAGTPDRRLSRPSGTARRAARRVQIAADTAAQGAQGDGDVAVEGGAGAGGFI